jgi:hypothetical protein
MSCDRHRPAHVIGALLSSHVIGALLSSHVIGALLSSHVIGALLSSHVIGSLLSSHVIGALLSSHVIGKGIGMIESDDDNKPKKIESDVKVAFREKEPTREGLS